MNKKYLMFGLPLLVIGLVVATMGFYAMFSASFTVEEAITISEDITQVIEGIHSSDKEIIVQGTPITITNIWNHISKYIINSS